MSLSASSDDSDTFNYNTTAFRPTFLAPGLTGCYAGTGGTTVMTVTSGDSSNWEPAAQLGNEAWPWHPADQDEVLTLDCKDFMRLPQVENDLMLSFQRDEVCTSYLDWDKEHPGAPSGKGYDPPGVYNNIVDTRWDCCGACVLEMEGAEILYFSTAETPSCSSASAAGRPATPSIVTPPAAIEERGVPMDSKFMVVDGSTL
ncbi:MAG: hypothetical protein Q9169_008325 [Polycauliona sp. 2 TL-2023]